MANCKPGIHLTLVAGIAGVFLILTVLPGLAEAAPVALPPRPPTHTPPPRPTSLPVLSTVPDGAMIELRVQFPQDGLEYHWQELWTVVQWQDEFDNWHEVEGWQGTLDEVVNGESGRVEGRKAWWLSSDLLGKGPFRWMVYRPQGHELIAESELFYLPDRDGAMLIVETSLAPQ